MKKLMMIAAMMVATLTVSAQQATGTFSIIPKAGINLSNLAGDVSGNSIKIGLVAGAEGMYQVNPLLGLSALMTTTIKAMADTISALREADLPCRLGSFRNR